MKAPLALVLLIAGSGCAHEARVASPPTIAAAPLERTFVASETFVVVSGSMQPTLEPPGPEDFLTTVKAELLETLDDDKATLASTELRAKAPPLASFEPPIVTWGDGGTGALHSERVVDPAEQSTEQQQQPGRFDPDTI